MYASAIHAWGWFKQLKRMREQKFKKTTEPVVSVKDEEDHKSHDDLWTFSDLVLVTTCFQIDVIYLSTMSYMLKNDYNPGFLQVMIMYATWGPALIYMEIFLGQYARHGCLYLKNMCPLTCSTIGFAMLSLAYAYSVAAVGRLADSYMFMFRSFSSELPWMVCPEGSTPATCIDRALLIKCYLENKLDNCYPKLGPELLSSRIYYKTTHSSFVNRVGLLLFGWITIYIALKRTLSDTRLMVKRLLLFMLLLFLCLLTPLMVYVGRGISVVPFFSLRHGAILSIGTWRTALKFFLRDHASVRGCWQLIGSHIKQGPAAANLTICSCALTYMVTVFSQIFSTGILGVLIFYMKVTHVDEELYFPKYAKLFNFYPFALGMLQVRQVWSLIFFTLIALSSISYTVVNLAIVEESIYDDYPALLRYRGYVKVILCILGFFLGTVSNLLTGSSSYEDQAVLQIASHLSKIIVLILTFSVGYIYGMERFSDDMNFLNGSQPTAYWKICWKSLPFGMLILFGSDMIDVTFPPNDLAQTASNIIYVILLTLAVLRLLYQIVMSIKAKNVGGILFQARPLWGPPLPEDRRLRNIYNPREETKYWRKNDLCMHHCLLNKDFIFSVIFSEIESRTNAARNSDALQDDFTTIVQQLKPNQAVIAIEKVSSAQLETFEEQLKQRIKILEETEETVVNFHPRSTVVTRKRIAVTKSMEELNNQANQMIKQAARKTELERGNDPSKVQKITSRTKQRRLPTFVPKETPRPKRTLNATATVTAHGKDNTDTEPDKVQTFAVQVPNFSLAPLKDILTARPVINLGASPALRCLNKLSSSKESQRKGVRKARLTKRKSRLPVWPCPLNTPRPVVSSRQSRSSSSTSTESSKVCRQPSNYFLNVRLPPKAELLLPTFSVKFHSPPRSPETPKSSSASSELSILNRDPVLREILRSVHPELYSAITHDATGVSLQYDAIDQTVLESKRCEASVTHPKPRISIAGKLQPIHVAPESPRSSCGLPRKHIVTNPPVPSPRPRPVRIKPALCESTFEGEALPPSVETNMVDSSVRYENNGITEYNSQRTGPGSVHLDIDRAIQIRIDNLLRGVKEPRHDTDQRPGDLSPLTKAENVLKATTATRGQRGSPEIGVRWIRRSQNSSRASKAKTKINDQSQATTFVTGKISAFGKRIAKRMIAGSTSLKIPRDPQVRNEFYEKSQNIANEEATLYVNQPKCQDPKQPSSSTKDTTRLRRSAE